MARIRTIKPEFWLNEELASLPPTTRLLAIGLLNHSDDEGYFVANPRVIRAAIFPFDDSLNIQGMLTELSRLDYIRLATGSDGKPYGFVVNFKKHQVVNRAKESKIKYLAEFSEDSVINHGIVTEPSLLERKGKEVEKEVEGNVLVARAPKKQLDYSCWPQMPSEQVLTDWLAMRKRLKADVSQTVINSFGSQLALAVQNGYTVDECLSECITGNWRGFKFSWLKNQEARNATNQRPTYQTRGERNEQAFRDYLAGLDTQEDSGSLLAGFIGPTTGK